MRWRILRKREYLAAEKFLRSRRNLGRTAIGFLVAKGIKTANGSGGLDCGNCEHFKPFKKHNQDGGQCQIYNMPIMVSAWRVCKKWQHEGLTENVQQQLSHIEPDMLYETTYDGLVPAEKLA